MFSDGIRTIWNEVGEPFLPEHAYLHTFNSFSYHNVLGFNDFVSNYRYLHLFLCNQSAGTCDSKVIVKLNEYISTYLPSMFIDTYGNPIKLFRCREEPHKTL